MILLMYVMCVASLWLQKVVNRWIVSSSLFFSEFMRRKEDFFFFFMKNEDEEIFSNDDADLKAMASSQIFKFSFNERLYLTLPESVSPVILF